MVISVGERAYPGESANELWSRSRYRVSISISIIINDSTIQQHIGGDGYRKSS